jgi:hypothetical protein
VLGARAHQHLSVLGPEHPLVVAELEAHLAVHDRPVLLLMRMEVGRERSAGLEPGVHDEVLAVGLEGVAGAMDWIVSLTVHGEYGSPAPHVLAGLIAERAAALA